MEPLREFAPDIWTADGPSVSVFGPLKLPTRMIVVKLSDGSLWINSPVCASPTEMEAVTRIGCVRYLVAPTPLHVWRLRDWKSAFPGAETWGPPSAARGSRDSSFDGVLGDDPPAAWAAELDQVVFRGNALLDEVEFFHRKSRTLIFTDYIQNYRAERGRPVRNAILKIAGVLGAGVPRDIRFSFARRQFGRESLRKLLSWDFDKLIVAHGDCLQNNAKPHVRSAFHWLNGAE